MRIFNLIITTKKKQIEYNAENFNLGWDASKKFYDKSTWSAINPVIHSLKELRKNTWDVERVDQAIEWLKDNLEVQDDD